MIGRRAFITRAALTLLAAPLAIEAQLAGKVWRIGYLSGNPQADTRQAEDAFHGALRDLGYIGARTCSSTTATLMASSSVFLNSPETLSTATSTSS